MRFEDKVAVVDLADATAVSTLRDDVIAAHGLPDVIVNAAGFDRVEPFMSNDDALWQALVAVNFLGPVRLTHAFLEKILAANGRAKIVNIASDAGRVCLPWTDRHPTVCVAAGQGS